MSIVRSCVRSVVRSPVSGVFGDSEFGPASLFLTGAAGAWYDPSDFSTLYQTSTGTTPVTAVEQPVGLMLDRSRGLVLGPELVTNGSFTTDSDWTKGTGWTISDGVATGTAGVQSDLSQSAILTVGATFVLEITVATLTAGSLVVFVGSTSNGIVAAGTYTFVVQCTANTNLTIRKTALFAGTISRVSAKLLPGNHASQATSTSRPVLRARYNLLTYTEDFSNAIWTKNGATAASSPVVNPRGVGQSHALIENTANSGHGFSWGSTLPANTAITIRTVAKRAAGTRNLRMTFYTASHGLRATINLDTQTVTNGSYGSSVYTSGSCVALTGDWFLITITGIPSTTEGNGVYSYDFVNGASISYVGDNTSGFWFSENSILTAADQTSTGGAYQRIADATDYDTSNPVFRPYLAFDGTDDSFGTSSIDFSGTDEMTVFAGVHKASDTVAAMLVELSVNKNSNAGSFYITAPELSGASGNFATVFRGSVNNIYVGSGTILAPVTAVITAFGDISADSQTIRTNGIAVTDTPDMGTGNFGNYPLYICRRGDTSLPFNGRLYSLAVLGRTATAAELSSMEAWVNGKTGAY